MDISELGGQEWTMKAAPANLFQYFPVGQQAVLPLKKFLGECFPLTVFYLVDDYVYWFWQTKSLRKIRNVLLEKVQDDPRFLDVLRVEWKRRLHVLEECWKKIDKTNLTTLSNNELYAFYIIWYDAYISEYGIAIGMQDAFSMLIDEIILEYFPDISSEEVLTLFSPSKDSFLKREQQELCKIARLQSKAQQEKALSKHADQWYWLENNYARAKKLDRSHFLKRLHELDVKKVIAESKTRKKHMLKEYSLNKKQKNIVAIADLFSYMQDERKKYVMMASHYHDMFLKELEKRTHYLYKELTCTYVLEIPKILKEEVPTSVLKERRKGVLVLFTEHGYHIKTGNEAKEAFMLLKGNVQEGGEVKGMVACAGNVKGKVKIVNTYHDVINFSGGVLISSMTRPEMMPAVKKAKAIVTDEGGITSHAAIVSRELNIPCIIGTKYATQVFKDGDEVEVNAKSGEVKKICQNR